MEYVNHLNLLVDDVQKRLHHSQTNVKTIQSILESWSSTPVLERKDNKKDTMLDLEGRVEKFKKR
jgi:dynein heavy chain